MLAEVDCPESSRRKRRSDSNFPKQIHKTKLGGFVIRVIVRL
jgi:hypothetical protein